MYLYRPPELPVGRNPGSGLPGVRQLFINPVFSEFYRMTIDRMIFAFAGIFILASLVLSQVHNVNWLWFTAFVGANLFQSAFTGFCPLARILKSLGARPGQAF
jgi:hypothetical protein